MPLLYCKAMLGGQYCKSLNEQKECQVIFTYFRKDGQKRISLWPREYTDRKKKNSLAQLKKKSNGAGA